MPLNDVQATRLWELLVLRDQVGGAGNAAREAVCNRITRRLGTANWADQDSHPLYRRTADRWEQAWGADWFSFVQLLDDVDAASATRAADEEGLLTWLEGQLTFQDEAEEARVRDIMRRAYGECESARESARRLAEEASEISSSAPLKDLLPSDFETVLARMGSVERYLTELSDYLHQSLMTFQAYVDSAVPALSGGGLAQGLGAYVGIVRDVQGKVVGAQRELEQLSEAARTVLKATAAKSYLKVAAAESSERKRKSQPGDIEAGGRAPSAPLPPSVERIRSLDERISGLQEFTGSVALIPGAAGYASTVKFSLNAGRRAHTAWQAAMGSSDLTDSQLIAALDRDPKILAKAVSGWVKETMDMLGQLLRNTPYVGDSAAARAVLSAALETISTRVRKNVEESAEKLDAEELVKITKKVIQKEVGKAFSSLRITELLKDPAKQKGRILQRALQKLSSEVGSTMYGATPSNPFSGSALAAALEGLTVQSVPVRVGTHDLEVTVDPVPTGREPEPPVDIPVVEEPITQSPSALRARHPARSALGDWVIGSAVLTSADGALPRTYRISAGLRGIELIGDFEATGPRRSVRGIAWQAPAPATVLRSDRAKRTAEGLTLDGVPTAGEWYDPFPSGHALFVAADGRLLVLAPSFIRPADPSVMPALGGLPEAAQGWVRVDVEAEVIAALPPASPPV
ncbi:hypothetical protein OHV05_37715 (plasmid) [Kitasatospora sp. NBC_00070]|uniref:hypothetical protein n=1 Tax=Kitasatospora sp. NBC_00070 TaxID=2975962 RepID=UPI00324DD9C3